MCVYTCPHQVYIRMYEYWGRGDKVDLRCQEYSSIALLTYSLGRVSLKPEFAEKGSLFRDPESLLFEGGNDAH